MRKIGLLFLFLAWLKVSQTVAGIFCDKIAFLFGIGFLEYELRIGPLYKIQGPENISLWVYCFCQCV